MLLHLWQVARASFEENSRQHPACRKDQSPHGAAWICARAARTAQTRPSRSYSPRVLRAGGSFAGPDPGSREGNEAAPVGPRVMNLPALFGESHLWMDGSG